MTQRFISIVLLVLFSSIAAHNTYRMLEYAINFKQISEELCENKNTQVTQCNGLCYLSEQIAKPTPLNNSFDLTEAGVNLSFLFYFFEANEQESGTLVSDNSTPYSRANKLQNQYIADIPVPPPSVL